MLFMTMEMKLQMYSKTKGVDMNLNDLLKVNNVRCIKTKVQEDLVDGEWKLLDDGCDVYEVGEVAYWKQIHPPRGVKQWKLN